MLMLSTTISRSKLMAIACLLFTSSLLTAQPTDDPNLINIATLAQLDAMRHDLDGDGRPGSAGKAAWEAAFGLSVIADDDEGTHAGNDTTGYELTQGLDFRNGFMDPTDYSIWAEGSTATGAVAEGWEPIGDASDRSKVYILHSYLSTEMATPSRTYPSSTDVLDT